MRVEYEQPKVVETGAKFIWQWLNLGTFWPALRGVHNPAGAAATTSCQLICMPFECATRNG